MAATICVRNHLILVTQLLIALLLCSPICAQAADKKQQSNKGTAATPAGPNGLQRRIDFGNSYILGQSIKSGAVYLLHRKKSEIKSMLHYREHYRDEILESFTVEADQGLGPEGSVGLEIETLEPQNKKMVPK